MDLNRAECTVLADADGVGDVRMTFGKLPNCCADGKGEQLFP